MSCTRMIFTGHMWIINYLASRGMIYLFAAPLLTCHTLMLTLISTFIIRHFTRGNAISIKRKTILTTWVALLFKAVDEPLN